MGNPNDHTVFEGPNERASAPKTGVGGGSQSALPNAHTAWASGPQVKTGPRPVDIALSEGEELSCGKCSFKTRIKPDYDYHVKKGPDGLTKCERQRKSFGAMKECGACGGQGETAKGVCGTCMGMGKVVDPTKGGPAAVDVDAIAQATAKAVNEALAPTMNAVADAIRQLAVTSAGKQKKQRKVKARGSSRMGRTGDAGARPASLPALESAVEPVADPPAGPEAAE